MTRPLLTTARLRLEPLGAGHAEELVALDGDPEVMRFLTGAARSREETLRDWVPLLSLDRSPGGQLGYWAGLVIEPVTETVEGRFAGWWALNPDPADPLAAELGYRLRRDHWGYGYATEGARALISHGFETVGLERIWAQTMAVNVRSRAVMERVGLRYERRVDKGEVSYALTRAQWAD